MKIQNNISRLIICQTSNFMDERGKFTKIHPNIDLPEFQEDGFSISKKNVLRGLHGDLENQKLITLLYGRIYWVAVDLKTSGTKKLASCKFEWSQDSNIQIFVPNGIVVGFHVLSDFAVVHYKQTKAYDSTIKQLAMRWDDPIADLEWPCDNPILSDRDIKIPLWSK